jgi:hypothetical protein
MRAHQIPELYMKISNAIDEGTVESPEIQALVEQLVLEGPIAVDAVVESIKTLEAERDGFVARKGSITDKIRSKENAIKRRREWLCWLLDTYFDGSMKTPEWNPSTKPVTKTIYKLKPGHTVDELPEDCVKVEKSLRLSEVERRLKDGESLPIETTTESTRTLVIR